LMQFGPEKFRVGIWDFLSNLVIDARVFGHTPVDGAYWSLFVEVKFYALVAISRLMLGDKFWAGLVGFATVSTVALPAAPGIAAEFMIAPYWPFFLFGIAGWLWISERQAGRASIVLLTSMALYGATYGSNHPAGIAPLLIDAFIGFASLSMLAMFFWSPTLRIPLLAPLGRISYSLYLIHQYIGVSLIGTLTAAGLAAWPAILVATAAMIGMAAILFRCVEQPGNLVLMALYRRIANGRRLQLIQQHLSR
jgi:peptidoglycan/LPS O-acetylase OafA/YrhL